MVDIPKTSPGAPAQVASLHAGQVLHTLESLAKRIIACQRCPRLVEHRAQVSRAKKKGFESWDYWGRPLPGFGDPAARLAIIGLAPAAHGGNRTGRLFTGDASARFLVSALHETGFANQPTSEHRDDGLQLTDAYLTAAARCCPPNDKPTTQELANCSEYLAAELRALPNTRIVLALGRIAFAAYLSFLAKEAAIKTALPFKHGAFYQFGEGVPVLCVSYHPSPRNTLTGRLRRQDFLALLRKVRRALDDTP